MLYVHMYKVIKNDHLASVYIFIYFNFTIAAVTIGPQKQTIKYIAH